MSPIPRDWTSDRLKDVSAINAASLPANTDADYEFNYLEISNVNYHGIVDRYAIERLRYEDAPSRARRRLATNCTAISSVRPNLQAVAFIEDAPDDLVCSTGFNVVKPAEHKLSPKFAYYSLLADGTRQYFEATAKGVGYPAVDDKDFQSFVVPLPPLPEQQRIAAYLDASCAAIDAAVAAKRRQLETLDALRKTTVHSAITQGLNRDIKMQSAGTQWLADVPAHWIASRIKNVAKLSPGYSGDLPANDELCTFVPMESLSNAGTVETGSLKPFEDVSSGFTFFEPGDVLFAKITPCMENGKGAFIASLPTRYAFGSTEFHVLRPGNAIDGEFLYYFTYNPIFRAYAAENMSGAAGQKRVSSRFLKETRLFLPPRNEQMEIVSFIKAKDKEFRGLFGQIELQIETLVLRPQCFQLHRRQFGRLPGKGSALEKHSAYFLFQRAGAPALDAAHLGVEVALERVVEVEDRHEVSPAQLSSQ